MVKALAAVGRRSVLLAPTGRAAKVFSRFAGHPAYTIHRRIYHTDPDSGEFNALAENTARPGTVFIVDEASMIGADNHVTCTSLLDDLIQYVYMSDGCRLILLGDTAQLPPVGCTESPAMSRDVLRSFRGFKSDACGTHCYRASGCRVGGALQCYMATESDAH